MAKYAWGDEDRRKEDNAAKRNLVDALLIVDQRRKDREKAEADAADADKKRKLTNKPTSLLGF